MIEQRVTYGTGGNGINDVWDGKPSPCGFEGIVSGAVRTTNDQETRPTTRSGTTLPSQQLKLCCQPR